MAFPEDRSGRSLEAGCLVVKSSILVTVRRCDRIRQMADPDWFTRRPPAPPRIPKPGELLFEFYRERDHKFFRCELRDHGEHGVEATFFEGDFSFMAHMFRDVDDGERITTARELAILWAEQERKTIEAYR
jgi:hypothetical protein